MKLRKKAQEEMVGFVLIVIIVAVILLVFLGFSLRTKKPAVENYEVDNFIQAMLQYTSDCENYVEFLSLKQLIFECDKEEQCLDGRDSCEVLRETSEKILDESWKTGEERVAKGYEFKAVVNADSDNEKSILLIEQGNSTNNYKGAMQNFAKSNRDYDIRFKVYY